MQKALDIRVEGGNYYRSRIYFKYGSKLYYFIIIHTTGNLGDVGWASEL